MVVITIAEDDPFSAERPHAFLAGGSNPGVHPWSLAGSP
eukprot:COSAG05_NODE_614_length_8342_cov_5.716851_3_plen_39_part_00